MDETELKLKIEELSRRLARLEARIIPRGMSDNLIDNEEVAEFLSILATHHKQ